MSNLTAVADASYDPFFATILTDHDQKYFDNFLSGISQGQPTEHLEDYSTFPVEPETYLTPTSSYPPTPTHPEEAEEVEQVTAKKRGPGRPRKSSEPAKGSKIAKIEDGKKLLTDAEKRENHVVSEQRRRRLIKEGFEVLVTLTPTLSDSTPASNGSAGNSGGGVHSKSIILSRAAEYIRELRAEIEELKHVRKATPRLHEPIAFHLPKIDVDSDRVHRRSSSSAATLQSGNTSKINSYQLGFASYQPDVDYSYSPNPPSS